LTIAETMHILLVEDDRSLTEIYTTAFTAAGHTVEHAKTGREALVLLYHWRYDVVLLDIMMPDGNGLTVLEQMQENEDATPVFINSNLEMRTKQEQAKAFPNVVDYLIKVEHSPKEIVKIVEDWHGGGDRTKNQ